MKFCCETLCVAEGAEDDDDDDEPLLCFLFTSYFRLLFAITRTTSCRAAPACVKYEMASLSYSTLYITVI